MPELSSPSSIMVVYGVGVTLTGGPVRELSVALVLTTEVTNS